MGLGAAWSRQRAGFGLLALLLACLSGASTAREWAPLDKDGLHDPTSPAIKLLQQPAEALSKLPPDTAGNLVRWVEALEQGAINPRTNIRPETKIKLREDDILLNLRGGMPIVRFPHRAHTLWLDCSNCHEHLFKSKTGANQISMLAILEGEQCGVCHGAVSFPLTECSRCHSVSRNVQRPASGAVVPLPGSGAAAPEPSPAGR
jgi:c(7)-type cytochrome triheme protein